MVRPNASNLPPFPSPRTQQYRNPAVVSFAISRLNRVSATVVQLALICLAAGMGGCASQGKRVIELPKADQFEREQLRIFSDFHMPRRHRLIDELAARRRDITDRLLLPMSDEPINVYLFDSAARFDTYMVSHHPTFPRRRAIFVQNDTELSVFAHWGAQVGEDLRHEVTHGYLHSVVPNIPLWLDEGLAEYFEQPRGQESLHHLHVTALVDAAKNDNWTPNLKRLEAITEPGELTQLDYAESWLWAHYMLESNPENRRALQDQLARIRMTGDADPLSTILESNDPNCNSSVIDHLGQLARTAATEP